MNKATFEFIGRLKDVPAINTGNNNSQYARMTVVCDETYLGSDQQQKTVSHFFNLICFKANLMNYLRKFKKGGLAIFRGVIKQKETTNPDGSRSYHTNFEVTDVQYIGFTTFTKENNGQNQNGQNNGQNQNGQNNGQGYNGQSNQGFPNQGQPQANNQNFNQNQNGQNNGQWNNGQGRGNNQNFSQNQNGQNNGQWNNGQGRGNNQGFNQNQNQHQNGQGYNQNQNGQNFNNGQGYNQDQHNGQGFANDGVNFNDMDSFYPDSINS